MPPRCANSLTGREGIFIVVPYRSIVSLRWLLTNVRGKPCRSPTTLTPPIWSDQSGTGDPILLIMGHAYGADMWHRTAPELAASYRVSRFDNRGVGRSSDPPGSYSVQLMTDDALAVLDAASAASAHVYGVSLGGAVALQLALNLLGNRRRA